MRRSANPLHLIFTLAFFSSCLSAFVRFG